MEDSRNNGAATTNGGSQVAHPLTESTLVDHPRSLISDENSSPSGAPKSAKDDRSRRGSSDSAQRRNAKASVKTSADTSPSKHSSSDIDTKTNTNEQRVKKEARSLSKSPRAMKSRSNSVASVDVPRPKLSRSTSQKKNKTQPPLFKDCPDVTEEACKTFQVIPDCLYGSKNMGSTDTDALDCDCTEEWRDGLNHSCGEDSDCINRATKMECTADGNCGSGCKNQRFQRRQYADVSVINAGKKGHGLRTNVDLSPDEFIYEYIGEVINESAFRRRMVNYDLEHGKHLYFMSLNNHEFVDATKKGNLGRFCNHSCEPNCYIDKWVVGEKMRMGIFALREIAAGEELVFDYNVDRYGADPQTCYCGSVNCVGYIGGKTQTNGAVNLSTARAEAMGVDVHNKWDAAVAKKPRKKKGENDEEFVRRLKTRDLDEEGTRNLMSQLMQCDERWHAECMLQRVQDCNDPSVIYTLMRMHGYQILKTVLNTFFDDNGVVLQVLIVLDRFPRKTRNKIQDSNIEATVQLLAEREDHPEVAASAKRLLEDWSKLEMGYRIARRKIDPNAPKALNSFEERRNQSREESTSKKDIVLGEDVPKGPKSDIPQRNNNFYGANRHNQFRKKFDSRPLPAGWFTATDAHGKLYFYSKDGTTRWDRPTEPAPEPVTSSEKVKQQRQLLQNIIEQVTKEKPTPKSSTDRTPQQNGTPTKESKKEHWRTLPVEKQMRIFENTIHPHIKAVADKFRSKFSKESWKKYFKEVSKSIVAHEYRSGHVQDPALDISRDRARKMKTKVKEFLDKAIVKERKAETVAKASEVGYVSTKVDQPISDTIDQALVASDVETSSASSNDLKRKRTEEDDSRQLFPDGPDTPPTKRLRDENMETGSVSSNELKRKRTEEDDSRELFPEGSETPSPKRLKENDTNSAPPPPPPPPPVDNEEIVAEVASMAEKASFREQEEALMRENEEAERLEAAERNPPEKDGTSQLDNDGALTK